MWSIKDYDELLTFSEFVKEHPLPTLFADTGFENDEATQKSIYDWFEFRKVVDNERFEKYFQRALRMCAWQYYQYLRVQNANIDPLVSDYMERQLEHTGSTSGTSSDNISDTTTTRRNGTNSGTGSNIVNGHIIGSGTNSETNNNTQTNSSQTSSSNSENTKSKHGETPQSAVGQGGGMALDWTYLTSQDESETTGTTNGNESGTITNQGTVSGTTSNETTSTSNATNTNSGEFSETGTVTKTNTGNKSDSTNSSSDDRERYSGRHEAPQDLLKRAIDYIESTNAFLWLTKYLDSCFMQILEV